MQNSMIHIEREFQELLNRLLCKVKLCLSVVCTSWAACDEISGSDKLSIHDVGKQTPCHCSMQQTIALWELGCLWLYTHWRDTCNNSNRYPSLYNPLFCKRPLPYFCPRALNSITITYSRRSLHVFHPLPKSHYSKAETIEVRALCDSTPSNSRTKLCVFKTTGFKINTLFKRMRKSWAGCQDRQKSQQFICLYLIKTCLFSEVLEKELLTLCGFKKIRPIYVFYPY